MSAFGSIQSAAAAVPNPIGAIQYTNRGNTEIAGNNTGAVGKNVRASAAAAAPRSIASHLSSLHAKLSAAVATGREDQIDSHLRTLARIKQRVDVPMTPEVRMAAYKQREPIRPEARMVCGPNGHRVTATQAKKQLTQVDVYTCKEKMPDGTICEAMAGGADVHPLHIEVRYLNPTDKNKYVDSVRWLSKAETDIQTREYIKGHPLVYPHLAEGVLFQ